jgi:hypothetical protein
MAQFKMPNGKMIIAFDFNGCPKIYKMAPNKLNFNNVNYKKSQLKSYSNDFNESFEIIYTQA